MQPHQHLVIIGNGIAGITLAQQVRLKSACTITLISSESAVHFSRPALMYVYMGHMRYQDIVPYADWYYQDQKLNMVQNTVTKVDFASKCLHLDTGPLVNYDVLVIATGSGSSFYNWPGVDLKGVQGLVTLQDLALMEEQTKGIQQAVVIGGGLIGIEMAEMLRSRAIEVTMLVRDKLFWGNNLPAEEAALVTNHIANHGINLLLNEELDEIIGNATGSVEAIKTKSEKHIPCQFVGVAIGVKPNINFLNNSELQVDKGILINEYFNTNIEHVYAIGDCAQFRNPVEASPAIEQLWYTARLHGESLGAILTGSSSPYKRGPWFNSAKFLDIEFQTYGYVPASPDPSEFRSFYWEHPAKSKAIRLLYAIESEKLIGINLLGVRYRHDLCHYWLQQGYTIHEVMHELQAANFDPEFFKHFEPEIQKQYQRSFPEKTLPLVKPNWWNLRKQYTLFKTNSNARSYHD
jgi:NADPH-dependent 2,4-dienoyl-CoA reductase/sulfur reductase-like enzyme